MKTFSLKTLMLTPLVLAMAILVGIFATSFLRFQHEHLSATVRNNLESLEKLFAAQLESDANMMGAALDVLRLDEQLRDALLAKDRKALLDQSQTLYKKFNLSRQITHFYYTGPDRVNILRVHMPDRYGDEINRFTTLAAEEKREISSGIELGPLGTFTLRVVAPWYDGERLVGYVELGEEIHHIIRKLRDVLGVEIYVAIEKEFLDRRNWEDGMRMLGRKTEWDHFPSVVLIDQTTDDFPEKLAAFMDEDHHTSMKTEVDVSLNDRLYRSGFIHLKDAGGRDLGDMAVLTDITALKAEFNAVIFFIFIICLSISAVLFFLFYLLIDRIEKRMNEKKEALQEAHNELEMRVERRTAELQEEIERRKETQGQLIKAKEDWEEAFNIINDAITIHDKDFNIIQANKAAEEMLGASMDKILKQKCFISYHGTNCAPAGCPSCQTLHTGIPTITEIFEPHLGKYIEIKALPRFDEKNELIGLVHVVRDIDARKRAEEEQHKLTSQLIHSQKMESIGRLAGGVAHDFNNLLSAIIGYSELALQELPADHPIAEDLQIIKDSGDRAAALTRQLLAFSRKQILEIKPINLCSVVENMSKMMKRLIGEDVDLDIRISATRTIEADPGQIEQVLLNLAVNARDAMPDGGSLIIEIAELEFDNTIVYRHEEMSPGHYAMLAITDTGIGMSKEIQEHIFEPFYTTKEKYKGTGLGLATVYGIIKQHNGYIYVYSEPGHGSSFKIYLPISGADQETRTVQETSARLPKGTETILVVEDEPAILRLVADILQPLGYKLLGAADADEAMKISNAHQEKIDLLLTDVIMPGKSGKELADALLKKRPDMKIVFMSGYTDEAISRLGVLAPGTNFIQKPLTSKKLAEMVRQVLSGR